MTQPAPPLARLFAIAYRQLVDGLHEGLRSRGYTDVRPAYGFVLLAVRDTPLTVTGIAALMGTTKQAASKLVAAMESGGYVRRRADESDGRRQLVTLTRRGSTLLDVVEEVYASLEQGWAEAVGSPRVAALREVLLDVLSDAEGRLPAVRPAP